MRRHLILAVFALAASTPVAAQDAARVQPQNYRVVIDNPQVRVLSYTGRPGMGVCGSGMHSHPAHLTVLLTPAKVRVTSGGKTEVHVMPAGTSFWEPAITHEVENIGGSDVRSLMVEVKRPKP